MLFALIACAGLLVPQDNPRLQLREPEKLFTRVAVIGASVADGQGLLTEVGARTSFAELVDASLRSAHGTPIDLATPRAWVQYDGNLRQWTVGAVARKATLVLAPDYLWWAAIAPEAEREGRLARALTALERIEVPLLLGDIPDFSHLAAALPTDFSLPVGHLPTQAECAALRERVQNWAKTQAWVVLVPYSNLYLQAQRGAPFELRGNRWAQEESKRWIQADRFHPSLEGNLLLLIASYDELSKAWPTLSMESIDWSIASIRQRLMEAKSADRAEEAARARKRAETERTPPPPPPEPIPVEKEPRRKRQGGGG